MENKTYKIGRPYSSICDGYNYEGELYYKRGLYISKKGVVHIHYQWRFPKRKQVMLTIYKDDKEFTRTIEGKEYSDKGLALIAGKFLKEIHLNNDQ